jgi:hypothetical protein
MEKERLKLLEIKRKLECAGLSGLLKDIAFLPEIPMLGAEKQFILTEHCGVKVLRLVSAPNE